MPRVFQQAPRKDYYKYRPRHEAKEYDNVVVSKYVLSDDLIAKINKEVFQDAAVLPSGFSFTRSITKAIGGFCWLMGGLDAIVFTGGIGEHDPFTRDEDLGAC